MNTYNGVWKCIQRLNQIYPIEVTAIFQRVGISKNLLANQNVSIPVKILLDFVIDAQSVFKDELISINFGRIAQIRPNYGEAFGLIFVYSKNLEEGFKLLQSYIYTELEGINFLISEDKNLIKIHSVADPNIQHPSIYENIGLSILASFIRSKRFQIKQINTKTSIQGNSVSKKKARIGRNPRNSQPVQIPEKNAIRWKMSKTFFNRLNKSFTEDKISDTY